MPTLTSDDLAQLRASLAQLDHRVYEQLPAPLSELLAQVVAASDSGDIVALESLGQSLAKESFGDQAQPVLSALMTQFRGAGAGLSQLLEGLQRQVSELDAEPPQGGSPQLREAVARVVAEVKFGAERAGLGALMGGVAEVFDELARSPAAADSGELLAEDLASAVVHLQSLNAPERLAGWADALRQTSDELHAALAQQGSDPRAMWLNAVMQEVAAMARGDEPSQVEPAYQRAYRVAIGAGELGLAQRSGRRLVAAAYDRRDMAAMRDIESELAALALEQGDLRGSAVGRLGVAHADRVMGQLERARQVLLPLIGELEVSAHADLLARAKLALGQLCIALELPVRAELLFEQAMQGAVDSNAADVLGRAAIGVAQVTQEADKRAQALTLALQVAQATSDASLMLRATLGLADDASQAGDLLTSAEHLVAGRDALAAHGAEPLLATLTQYVAALEAQWGTEAVAQALSKATAAR